MGQHDIYILIKKHKFLTTRQINEKTGLSPGSVSVALRKLCEHSDVCKIVGLIRPRERGNCKMPFYYLKKDESKIQKLIKDKYPIVYEFNDYDG